MITAPLKSVSKDVFFVLDGLDEAEWDVDDCVSEGKTEMSILINCFSSLATTSSNSRLLPISRPDINAKTHAPEAIIRPLMYNENFEDIRSYVEIELIHKLELRSHFDKTDPRIDPVEYIPKASKGIFLWAATMLSRELSKPKISFNAFKRCLSSFENASASPKLTNLWDSVISIVKDESKALNFPGLLELDCGSLLRRITLPDGKTGYELAHETLRSYLLGRESSKKEIVDENMTHIKVASCCLSSLLHPWIASDLTLCREFLGRPPI
jgi:hypothetical protein